MEIVIGPDLAAFIEREGAFTEETKIMKEHMVVWHELLGKYGSQGVTGVQAMVVGARNLVPKEDKRFLMDLAFLQVDELHFIVFHDVEVTYMISENPDEQNPMGMPICSPDDFIQVRDLVNKFVDHRDAVENRTHLKLVGKKDNES
jgi:hypothetical protein